MNKQHLRHDLSAVIDIGSNSVRLVVFDNNQKVIQELKFTCGLARGLSAKHCALDPKGMLLTLDALREFDKVIKSLRVPSNRIIAAATAAMRTVIPTPAGRDFYALLQETLGHDIVILSGEEEAALSALAILQAFDAKRAITADLGGASCDIAQIIGGKIVKASSIPLGSLTIKRSKKWSPKDAAHDLGEHLKHIGAGFEHSPVLYAIGGNWRAIARYVQHRENMAAKPAHGFHILRDDLSEYLDDLIASKPSHFRGYPDKVRKRAGTLPQAALILRALIDHFGVSTVIFSEAGLRHGLLNLPLLHRSCANQPKPFSCPGWRGLTLPALMQAPSRRIARVANL